MKIAYNFPFHSCPPVAELVSGEAIAGLAELLETHGFASAALTDHPAPSEAWRQAGGHDTLDPFVGLAFIAAATSGAAAPHLPRGASVPQPVPHREDGRHPRRAVGRAGSTSAWAPAT